MSLSTESLIGHLFVSPPALITVLVGEQEESRGEPGKRWDEDDGPQTIIGGTQSNENEFPYYGEYLWKVFSQQKHSTHH